MSHSVYLWVKAFHVVGILIWAGAMMSVAHMLVAAGKGNEADRKALIPLATVAARMMDAGALVAIGCAVYLAIGTRSWMGEAWVMKQPWMHVKLTIVVLAILGGHGFLRSKLGKYRRGKPTTPVPPVIVPVLSLALIAVVVFAVARPIG